MVTIRKRYDERVRVGLECNPESEKGRSRTKQSFAKEADINSIMARYEKTGVLVDPSSVNNKRFPQFGDFSSGVELLDIQNRIVEANQSFETLPSRLRRMFDNSPAKLLDFLADPANTEEAIELGLMEAPEPAPEVPEAPVVPEGGTTPSEAPTEPTGGTVEPTN